MRKSDSSKFVRRKLKAYLRHIMRIDEYAAKSSSLAEKALNVKEFALNDFKVMYGYFTLLDKRADKASYKSSPQRPKREVRRQEHPEMNENPAIQPDWHLPFPLCRKDRDQYDLNAVEEVILAKSNQNSFTDGLLEMPKEFLYMPSAEADILKSCFTYTELQNTVQARKQGYSVVLAEEILFFLYAYLYASHKDACSFEELNLGKQVNIGGKLTYPHLIQLIKYAINIECIFEKEGYEPFCKHLGFDYNGIRDSWGKQELERKLRILIETTIEQSISQHLNASSANTVEQWFKTNVEEPLHGLIEDWIKGLRGLLEIHLTRDYSNKEFIERIARFQPEVSLHLLKADNHTIHDLFVFPVENNTMGEYKIKIPVDFQKKGQKTTSIKHPILLCVYVQTLYAWKEQLDEDPNSMRGFKITEMLLQHIAKPVIELAYHQDWVQNQKLPEKTRYGIARIMSRNLSHTDGSHVMPAFEKMLRQKLKTGLAKMRQDVLENKKGALADEGWLNNALNEFSTYNSYLINTMELVADVSGGFGNQSKYDYKFASIFHQLSGEFLGNKFLGKGLFDRHDDAMEISLEYLGPSVEERMVSLPGGVNGFAAILTIVKNCIRNHYKHAPGEKDKLALSIALKDPSLLGTENSSVLSDFLYQVDLVVESYRYSGHEIENVKNKIKKYLNRAIIKNGEVVASGWGILEMKIAAAYLIGLPIDYFFPDFIKAKHPDDLGLIQVDDKLYPRDVIGIGSTKAEPHNPKHEEFYLTYSFYLIKPKYCLVRCSSCVSEKKVHCFQMDSREYEKAGIHLSREKVALNQENYKFVLGEPFAHLEESRENMPHTTAISKRSYPIKASNFRNVAKCPGIDNVKSIDEFKEFIGDEYIKHFREAEKRSPLKFLWINTNPTEEELKALDKKIKKSKKQPDLAVLHDHGSFPLPLGESDTKKSKDELTFQDLHGRFGYYEAYGSISGLTKYWERAKNWEKQEMVLTRIAILDERIQAETERHDPILSKMTLRESLMLKGIFIPEPIQHKENYDRVNYHLDTLAYQHKDWRLFSDSVQYYFQVLQCHYVVVHLSVLETLGDASEMGFQRYYESLVEHSKNPDELRHLVITSGKGTPSTLPDGCLFINLNTLKNSMQQEAKYPLVQALTAIRRIKTKKS